MVKKAKRCKKKGNKSTYKKRPKPRKMKNCKKRKSAGKFKKIFAGKRGRKTKKRASPKRMTYLNRARSLIHMGRLG